MYEEEKLTQSSFWFNHWCVKIDESFCSGSPIQSDVIPCSVLSEICFLTEFIALEFFLPRSLTCQLANEE